ncbi:hypothetical protein VB711_18005 [Cronbergia sp. UHCC 0137]|uniref:hypothetical protein n=1 Tax=Cronbergia sp. UHCC 0137 TaxID=3110239 RepID=UPI002B215808|nr:hypothetical protein [Cronbergia sp. UHCC 0137]MEA5619720.1 hypothetical protein [Cronbergia sp. UHCC 0137]
MKLGLALIPNIENIKAIVKLQQKVISLIPLQPILGTELNLPHITLIQGRFKPDVNWINIISNLRDHIKTQNYRLEFKLTELEFKRSGWYFLNPSSNIIFSQSHKFVFDNLKTSMYLTEEDLYQDISNYSDLEKANYLKYGYRFIGDAFQPHITLGRYLNKNQIGITENLFNLVNPFISNYQGILEKITLYEMGENGSHSRTLSSLDI